VTTRGSSIGRLVGLVIVLLIAGWWLSGHQPNGGALAPGVDPTSGLAVVALADLPLEATVTVHLIDAGGPFPYAQDGAVFENREGLLPAGAGGTYHEFTVVTPGSADRGTRRIITGRDGAMYYTDDHYASFRWIAR
jgi:ribonuclease T1